MSQDEFRQETPETSENGDQTEGKISRRKLLAIGAAGVALAVPIIAATYRWLDHQKGLEIILQGPFGGYGKYLPEDFEIRSKNGFFDLQSITFIEGNNHDGIVAHFSCDGPENVNRFFEIEILAFGNDKSVICHTIEVFRDPRVVAKEIDDIYPEIRLPSDRLALDFPKNIRIDNIDRIVLRITEKS